MKRRRRCGLRPSIERVEPLILLSSVTSLLVSNALMNHHRHVLRLGAASVSGGQASGFSVQSPPFVPSLTALPQARGQGPQGLNQAVTPTGTLTPHELRREKFVARFVGPYTVGAGRTDTEARQTYIRGVGGANTFLHGDIVHTCDEGPRPLVRPAAPPLPG